MAKVQGRVLFTDEPQQSKSAPMELTLSKAGYKPKILFQDEPEQTGFRGIGHDIMGAVKSIPGVLGALPGQLEGIGEQAMNDPMRIAKNLGAGIGEAGVGLLNTPHDIIKYLGKKELIPEALKKYNDLPFTHIPESWVQKGEEAIGLDREQQGDALLKLIPALLGGYGAKKLLGPRSLRSLEKELGSNKSFIEQVGEKHRQALGEGQEHAARASQGFLDFIEGKVNPETGRTEGGLRREIGSQYEQLSNDMANERVQIHQTPDMKAIQKSLTKLGKGVSGPEREKLLKMMTQADSKLKTVSGADALTAYRELKRQRSKSMQSAHEPGIGPAEHEQWIKRAEEFGSLEAKMKAMLEQQIGGKWLERLKAIDKDYATKIAPLSENSMYQEMRKHGQTSKNIMKYLNGKTAGNQTLNDIVSGNPELQRLLVGQQFASKPEKLGDASELLTKYRNLNPHIARMIEEQQTAKAFKEKMPELEQQKKRLEEKQKSKKAFRKNVASAVGGAGLLYAIETALGRDWQKDFPSLVEAYQLNKLRKIK